MHCPGCTMQILDEDVMRCPRCGADLGRAKRPKDYQAAHIAARPEAEPRTMNQCPECGERMIPADGCAHCPACGYGHCG